MTFGRTGSTKFPWLRYWTWEVCAHVTRRTNLGGCGKPLGQVWQFGPTRYHWHKGILHSKWNQWSISKQKSLTSGCFGGGKKSYTIAIPVEERPALLDKTSCKRASFLCVFLHIVAWRTMCVTYISQKISELFITPDHFHPADSGESKVLLHSHGEGSSWHQITFYDFFKIF